MFLLIIAVSNALVVIGVLYTISCEVKRSSIDQYKIRLERSDAQYAKIILEKYEVHYPEYFAKAAPEVKSKSRISNTITLFAMTTMTIVAFLQFFLQE